MADIDFSASETTVYDTNFSTWNAEVEFDFDFDGSTDSYSYESYDSHNTKHGHSSTGSFSTYIDGATGETTETSETTTYDKEGNVASHLEASVQRDANGKIIEANSTFTKADGSTVKTTTKDGKTVEERYDEDGNLIATVEYESSFWDPDVVYGTGDMEMLNFSEASPEAGAILLAEHFESGMAPEMVVDAFEFLM